MKRIVILIAVLTILIFPVAALDSSVEIGVNLSYNTADEVLKEDGNSGVSFLDRIAVGLEMRANVSNFQIALMGDISIIDTQSVLFAGIFTAGFSVEMFKYLKLGITTGPKVSYLYRDTVKSVSGDGEVGNGEGFFDALYNGYFHHRIMLDVLAGPVMTIGVAYTVPTTFSLAEPAWGKILPTRTDLKEGQVAVCITMKVF